MLRFRLSDMSSIVTKTNKGVNTSDDKKLFNMVIFLYAHFTLPATPTFLIASCVLKPWDGTFIGQREEDECLISASPDALQAVFICLSFIIEKVCTEKSFGSAPTTK